MALRPYQQRTGVPQSAGGGVPQTVSTAVRDVGPAFQGLGQTLTRVLEPQLRQRAVEQARKDFGAMGIGRDANGNFTLPETPEGAGIAYAQTFNQIAERQFVRDTQLEAQRRIEEIYSDEANIGLTAEDLDELAQAQIEGLIGATPDQLRPAIEDGLKREALMFYRQRNAQDFRTEWSNRSTNAKNQLTQLLGRFEGIAETGIQNEHTKAMLEAMTLEIDEVLDEMEVLRDITPEGRALLAQQMGEMVSLGSFMAVFREGQTGRNAAETDILMDMLSGNGVPGQTAYGMTEEDIWKLLPTAAMRGAALQRIRPQYSDQVAREREIAQRTRLDRMLDILPPGMGFGSASPEDQRGMAGAYLQRQQVNAFDPNAPELLYQRFGQLPEGLYENALKGIANWDYGRFSQMAPLLSGLENVRGRDGDMNNLLHGVLSDEDAAYYAMIKSLQMGEDPDQARAIFTEVNEAFQAQGVRSKPELYNNLLNESRLGNNEKLHQAIADALDVSDFDALGSAGLWAKNYMATLVATGQSFENAAKQTRERFERNFSQDPFSLQNMENRRATGDIIEMPVTGWDLFTFPSQLFKFHAGDGGYVHNSEKPAQIGGMGFDQQHWEMGLIDHALRNIADPEILERQGLSSWDEMRLGVNLARKHVRNGADGSQLFQLYYIDTDDNNLREPLTDTDGNIITIDYGTAAAKVRSDIDAWNVSRAEAEQELREVTVALPFTNEGNKERQRLRREFEEQYGVAPFSIDAAAETGRAFNWNDFTTMRRDSEPRGGLQHPAFNGYNVEDYARPDMRSITMAANEREARVQGVELPPEATGPLMHRSVNAFMTNGLFDNPLDAIALVGALQGESGAGFSVRNQRGDNGSAHGIAQWRLDRVTNFEKRYGRSLTEANADMSDELGLNQQLDYVAHELKTTHRRAWERMQREPTLEGKIRILLDTPASGGYFGVSSSVYEDTLARRLRYARALQREMGVR